MAKKTVTTHKFYVVDLVRKKPATQYIEIPKYRVDVDIEVTTKGVLKAPAPVPSTALKRLEDAARAELERYEDVIAAEAKRLDAKVVELMQQPSKSGLAEANKMIATTNSMINKALASAEGAAQKAIVTFIKLRGSSIRQAIERQGLTDTSGLDFTKPLSAIKDAVKKIQAAGWAGSRRAPRNAPTPVRRRGRVAFWARRRAGRRNPCPTAVIRFLRPTSGNVEEEPCSRNLWRRSWALWWELCARGRSRGARRGRPR